MPPVGFEPTTGERPQSYSLDREDNGTGHLFLKHEKNGDYNFHVFEVPLFHLLWQGV